MNPEQKRIAIAEACGWQDICILSNGVPYGWHQVNHPQNSYKYSTPLPDYLNDLNAMHEVEKVMTCEQMEDYADKLQNMCGGNKYIFDYTPVFATAAKRADAFIATLGLDKQLQ